MGAIRAETTALAKLVERDTAEGGQVLDLLRVAPGYEKALGAALADDLRAPLVEGDGPRAGCRWRGMTAISLCRRVRTAGTAYLWPGSPQPPDCADRSGGCGSGRALAGLMFLMPGQRLVSRSGDLWRWDGFRAWAEDAPSAAALRLEQLNKLEALKQELTRTEAQADGARAAHEALSQQLADVTEADRRAREARRAADQRMAETARLLSRAEADRNLAQGKLETLTLAVDRHKEDAMAARAQLREAEGALTGLGDLDSARAQVEDIKQTVEAARITMLTHRSTHDELRREGEARTRRSQEVTKDLSGWRHRLETAEKRISELAERKESSEEELTDAMAARSEIAEAREELNELIETAEARRAEAADKLAEAETQQREVVWPSARPNVWPPKRAKLRAAAEARCDAAKESVVAAAERIAEDQQLTPNQLLNQLDVNPDQMPAADALESEVNRHKRQRDAMGAVNLRAEEDSKEVQEEFDTLNSEKADLEEAIKALRSGIASLNREGRERLLTAFEQVNSNFAMLFKHLFGGGEANLVMVESDDPLDAGLEIMCQPPGKKLSTLSLLSGGEQTLTATALIFGVFLANPAPICVLDEVDAPLDDANVTRFCDLLDEMCRQTDTRFLIITHHAVTMARMDRLFGVTMQEQGVSQLVSVDLKKAEQMVA